MNDEKNDTGSDAYEQLRQRVDASLWTAGAVLADPSCREMVTVEDLRQLDDMLAAWFDNSVMHRRIENRRKRAQTHAVALVASCCVPFSTASTPSVGPPVPLRASAGISCKAKHAVPAHAVKSGNNSATILMPLFSGAAAAEASQVAREWHEGRGRRGRPRHDADGLRPRPALLEKFQELLGIPEGKRAKIDVLKSSQEYLQRPRAAKRKVHDARKP